MEKAAVPPLTFLLNLVVLLVKPTGGHRPIALVMMLYALWGKVRRHDQQEWDSQRAGFWDHAVAGSSALLAALTRRLRDETACTLGRHSLTVLWDVHKFYDSVSPDLLVSLADDLSYPPLHLYMGMFVHVAPRVIRTDVGCLSVGTRVDSSIIAGDGQSNSWARAFVHRLLDKAHADFFPANSRVRR